MTTNNETTCRKAFTLAETARFFGKHRSWCYRMVREGRIQTINGYGAKLIPAHEIDRILGATQQTNEG